ncbi:MAG TPA: hypothetical protein VFA57_10210 [Pseudolabrys sp.]|nr:hypothetical protein [Pseudolabrys sp.]
MAGAQTIERLRIYLRELAPPARALLTAECERSLLRGEEAAGIALLLAELHEIGGDQPPGMDRYVRLFCQPLEPFLVDDAAAHDHPGRIARCSLEMLWTWIRRDLLPVQARRLEERLAEALRSGDAAAIAALTRAFQDKAAAAIAASLAAAGDDERVRRRTIAQIGTPRAEEDARALQWILSGRDDLAALAARLPLHVASVSEAAIDEYRALIEQTCARDANLFVYALLLVMSRLAAPWQIIRFGIQAAGVHTAARIAQTPYGVTVTIVLAELDRMVRALRADLHRATAAPVAALLKAIHDTLRGLRIEIDLPMDSTWGRALAAQRRQVAQLLHANIASAPARLRRVLDTRVSPHVGADAARNPREVAEVEALLRLVGDCRPFAGELAIAEATQQAFHEIQQTLEDRMRALFDPARHAGVDHGCRRSQIDAAARFCTQVFGERYAARLAKAAAVAGSAELLRAS